MLSIILINYRMKKQLINCLESIVRTQNVRDLEVILVNKPSNDDTEEDMRRKFPFVRIVSTRKFGVGFMRNLGLKSARGDHILFLDVDTVIQNDIKPALEVLQKHADAAGLGVRIVGPDGKLQYTCRRFYDFKTILYRRTFLGSIFPDSPVIRNHLMMDWDHNSLRRVDWVQGAFFLVKRKALNDIGFFDEFSPFGFEDVAWCWRAYKKGWNIYYYPGVTIMHEYRRTSARIFSVEALYHFVAFLKFYVRYGFF